MALKNTIFNNSPMFLKEILINLEACSRDSYRRWGDYEKRVLTMDATDMFSGKYQEIQEKLFQELMTSVSRDVPAYENINDIKTLSDIKKLPVLEKRDIIKNIDHYLARGLNKKKLYKGLTSGSTGKPLTFYKDRESVRQNYLYMDKLYQWAGVTPHDIKCRISGVCLFNYYKKKPPYWVYIKRYRQLQCSIFHLNENNFSSYLDAMIKYGVTVGTGYARTWFFLADYIMKHKCKLPKLKVILLDSEGLTNKQQDIVEQVFNCKAYQSYGLQEVGQVAFQCKDRHYHIIPQTAYVEVVDDNYSVITDGQVGQIVVTSLYSKKTPFIRYTTGDLGVLNHESCSCGLKTPYLSDITGRVDDYILTKEGTKLSCAAYIIDPAKGVLNSQLVQIGLDKILINIVPDNNFDKASMDDVITLAKKCLGEMDISWQLVADLERTKNGKIRHVVRKI